MKKIVVIVGFIFAYISVGCGNNSATAGNAPMEQPNLLTSMTAEDREFKIINQDQINTLNKSIIEHKLNSIEMIMQEYAPEDVDAEGNYTYIITKANTNDPNKYTLTLLEDGINDDSKKALKVIMTVEKKKDNYKVISIKESYQCWKNRGHQDWGADYCQ
ncbi:hypothetical protein LNQ81_09300 [Myroides sp. M-43]|uniref:hypothetical protein n=1 Tax=Myroides oncorhynchi TaxID=2893756 RepID=UPI001E359F7C|nr:hypothetical protein [Myroides oncorhynchi]MCC9042871.1 hypothetical protein [Myroides oncorhynchi]